MTIGIIGAGGIGQAFATHVAKAGYEVILSNRRGRESLTDVVSQIGGKARGGTRDEAARADVVFVAVWWPEIGEMLSYLPASNGGIFFYATNTMVPPPTHFDL